MFKSSARRASEQVSNLDFTQLLSDSNCYSLGNLIDLGISSQLTALAFGKFAALSLFLSLFPMNGDVDINVMNYFRSSTKFISSCYRRR